jgi:hypothetical protein
MPSGPVTRPRRDTTTAVLWLSDVFGMDIRCVRLTPYKVDGPLLLDVQPVIPLPEAEELTVQLRRRETAARGASASGRDWTPYLVISPNGHTEPLRKRHAIHTMVRELHAAGVPAAQLATVLPRSKFLSVDGQLTGDELTAAFIARYPNARNRIRRWFLNEPLHDGNHTWVLSNQWGSTTVATLDALVALAPDQGFGYEPADVPPGMDRSTTTCRARRACDQPVAITSAPTTSKHPLRWREPKAMWRTATLPCPVVLSHRR